MVLAFTHPIDTGTRFMSTSPEANIICVDFVYKGFSRGYFAFEVFLRDSLEKSMEKDFISSRELYSRFKREFVIYEEGNISASVVQKMGVSRVRIGYEMLLDEWLVARADYRSRIFIPKSESLYSDLESLVVNSRAQT